MFSFFFWLVRWEYLADLFNQRQARRQNRGCERLVRQLPCTVNPACCSEHRRETSNHSGDVEEYFMALPCLVWTLHELVCGVYHSNGSGQDHNYIRVQGSNTLYRCTRVASLRRVRIVWSWIHAPWSVSCTQVLPNWSISDLCHGLMIRVTVSHHL